MNTDTKIFVTRKGEEFHPNLKADLKQQIRRQKGENIKKTTQNLFCKFLYFKGYRT